jgi:hypothetical protein
MAKSPRPDPPGWLIAAHGLITAAGIFLYSIIVLSAEVLFGPLLGVLVIGVPLFYLGGLLWLFHHRRFTCHTLFHLVGFIFVACAAPAFISPLGRKGPFLLIIVVMGTEIMVLAGMVLLAVFGRRRVNIALPATSG